ncbi:MAG: N-acetylmuramoyl-L-alanine amidase-like domain-containing protein [Candidatus Aminicenantales bacterium]
MRRRDFLSATAELGLPFFLWSFVHAGSKFFSPGSIQEAYRPDQRTQKIFSEIMKTAGRKGWAALPIGECMGRIGQLLLGTPYVAFTIEASGPEVCRVVLTGVDCVTFYENVLCMARILKKGKSAMSDLLQEIAFTRYRGGKLTDYTSRLHYTSDWIYDNEQKKVVRNITAELGGKKYPLRVSFMSENPGYYAALVENPGFIQVIARFERMINERIHYYIPLSRVKKVEKRLQTGDIIAFTTSKKGLDYSHTGLAYRDGKGMLRLMHASSKEKKVILDGELSEYGSSVNTHTGITVARPLEPKPT